MWRRPPAESPEAVQLSVLAQATVPILERYYLALALLLKAGQRPADAGSARAPVPADGAAHGAAVRDQFARSSSTARCSSNFLEPAARAQVLSVTDEDRLEFDAGMLEAIVSDAQMVLNEQVRNSILQVVHR